MKTIDELTAYLRDHGITMHDDTRRAFSRALTRPRPQIAETLRACGKADLFYVKGLKRRRPLNKNEIDGMLTFLGLAPR